MKKSILTLLAALCLGSLVAQNTPPASNPPSGTNTQKKTTTTQQQSTTTMQPPGAVTKRFSTDYPNVSSTWTVSGTNYRAEYLDPSTKTGRAVIYDQYGNPTGMEKEVTRTDYPPAITDYYIASYPSEDYRVWVTDDKTGKPIYFISRSTEVLWFDDKGTFMRKDPRSYEMAK